MSSISVAQAQAFDRLAQEKFGIPSLILMENAGRGVAEEAIRMLRGMGYEGRRGKVAFVCGVGNNGGDGLVAARHLLNAGKKVSVYLIGKASKLKADPKTNLNILRRIGQKIICCEETEKFILRFPSVMKKADLIIDAIFGIGLKSEVKKPYSEIINYINQAKRPVLAVDVPSGLDADSGRVLGTAIKANQTVTFVAAKKGFFKNQGPKFCGKIIVRDIGIT